MPANTATAPHRALAKEALKPAAETRKEKAKDKGKVGAHLNAHADVTERPVKLLRALATTKQEAKVKAREKRSVLVLTQKEKMKAKGMEKAKKPGEPGGNEGASDESAGARAQRPFEKNRERRATC